MPEKNVETLDDAVRRLIEKRRFGALHDILVDLEPADIAAMFSEMPENGLSALFRLLPKDLAAEVFVEMDSDLQELLIKGFTDNELKAVVEELYVDDTVDILEEMPANVVKRILRQTDPETRSQINHILNYPDDSAGSIMTTEFVDLHRGMTVAQCLDLIRRTAQDRETIHTCDVTDGRRQLLGYVTLRALILAADEDTPVEALMHTHIITTTTLEDKEQVAAIIGKYDLTALPVVDGEGRLVGIVTMDDALDVIQEEATEDMEKMGAITPSDRPYLKTGVWQLWKNRIPWLLLLMLSATFTGMIINHFESALAGQLALTAFIPMLMGTGGNSGSQASVTVIRSLSLNEVDLKDIFRVVWIEFRVSLLCGVTLAVVNFAKLMLLDRLGLMVSLSVSLTLVATVFTAKLVGCTLPMITKKIGLDPAVMASPLITTIVDALSLLIYFSIATALLGL